MSPVRTNAVSFARKVERATVYSWAFEPLALFGQNLHPAKS